MKIVYHSKYNQQLANYGIEIPLEKSREAKVFDGLLSAGHVLEETNLKLLPSIARQDLLRVHEEEFIDRFLSNDHFKGELFKTFELIDEEGNYHRYNPDNATRDLIELRDRVIAQVGLNYLSLEIALNDNGSVFFLGGGMHHGMPGVGRGFCQLNDSVITLSKLKSEGKINRAWIIDVDAHKGDGTAVCSKDMDWLSTLSIHMGDGWPFGTEEGDWCTPSSIDIEMYRGEEEYYLSRLEAGLEKLRTEFGASDICVVVLGADPFEGDVLESTQTLKLTSEQMLTRDWMVENFLAKLGIPRVYVMGGGYGPQAHQIYFQFIDDVLRKS